METRQNEEENQIKKPQGWMERGMASRDAFTRARDMDGRLMAIAEHT